ncbi:MAG: ATPase AAA-2 domain protein [Candidatus Magasanikbacteria bacterium GW2011_GWC2_42_27]|nr:MAG: ATPase AAA-2 domain protein [Candidatus Magasanikbacteria bacterium GW2011_GWC2_42_27]
MNYFQLTEWFGAVLIVIAILIYYSSKKGGLSIPFLPNMKSSHSSSSSYGGFTTDITEQAHEGKVDPVIGRDEEITRVTQILTRRRKNNVILVGEPGVGKTAIVEGLALKIVTGDVPAVLANKRVLVLQVADLISGTKYRGEFEHRVKQLVDYIKNSDRSIILFIDEIHTIMQTKGTEGSVNISDILKPALARGELQVIGATTSKEYDQYILPDESWERRFQKVMVHEPSIKESIEILKGLKKNYELYHKVIFTDESIEEAVTLSEKYIKDRHLPDKAIDLIDEAAAMIHVHEKEAPDHAVALLYGAANTLAKENGMEGETITKLKKELLSLRREEMSLTDAKKIEALRKDIVKKVKEIQKEESTVLEKKGWPKVTAEKNG